MKSIKKKKVSRQEYLGKRHAKTLGTYLKNRGIRRSKKQLIKLV